MSQTPGDDRTNEWFVPVFGPPRFRRLVGMLFLPYTGMVLSFTVLGSMLAPLVHWDRVLAIGVIYLLALGVGAHALDAIGGRAGRPWGNAFSRRALWGLAGGSVALGYAIGIYYMVCCVPALWPIAVAEGFFLLAYNLEWWNGRFHTDRWFAFSWGALPVLAGYVMQTNTLATGALVLAAAAALLSLVEIRASRPYKAIRRGRTEGVIPAEEVAGVLESLLKPLSAGVIVLGGGALIGKWLG